MAIGYKERIKEGSAPKPTRFFSNEQEKSVAIATGGKQTKNSGATPWQKGDVLTNGEESFLIECKTKVKKSNTITIREDWFEKNRQEMAFQGRKHQAIVFNFGPDEENHYIIDEYLFLELLEYLKSKKD